MYFRAWAAYGADVQISTHDITTEAGCEGMLKMANAMGPVEAIFNLAVILKDSIFQNQTPESFRTSFAPKAMATMNLDKLSRKLCRGLKWADTIVLLEWFSQFKGKCWLISSITGTLSYSPPCLAVAVTPVKPTTACRTLWWKGYANWERHRVSLLLQFSGVLSGTWVVKTLIKWWNISILSQLFLYLWQRIFLMSSIMPKRASVACLVHRKGHAHNNSCLALSY